MKNTIVKLATVTLFCMTLTACNQYHLEKPIENYNWHVEWGIPDRDDNHYDEGDKMQFVIKDGKLESFFTQTKPKKGSTSSWDNKTIVRKGDQRYHEAGESALLDFYFLDEEGGEEHYAILAFMNVISGMPVEVTNSAGARIKEHKPAFTFDIVHVSDKDKAIDTKLIIDLLQSHGKGGGTGNRR